MSDEESIRADLADAITSVFARHEQSVTVKWLALIETVTGDGGGLWTFASEGATAWDTLGLLTYAVQMEQAKAVCHHGEER